MGVAARLAQSVGLRLAAPFRDRLGEIGEQHRKPEPCGDLAGEQSESRCAVTRSRIEKPVTTADDHFGDEDNRVLRQLARIELAKRVDRSAADDGRIEEAGAAAFADMGDLRSEGFAASIRKCSTIGPSASAGKYCRR